jgi:hypothetical protein
MLYNRAWNNQYKNPHSLVNLIQWLGEQDPNQEYEYYSNCNCLLSQYYKAKGFWRVRMFHNFFRHAFIKTTMLPKHFNAIAEAAPRNFGAAHKRALKHYFEYETV